MVVNNEGWPESFGFSIAGDAPVVVVSILENSVAESAGLHVGDQIVEIDDKNVQGLSKEQIIVLAKRSTRVPPSLVVISRIRTFRLPRRRQGYGLTLRGSKPVHVESVAKNSPAYEAGICPGDMLIQVNGRSVKRLNKVDVTRLLDLSGSHVTVKLVAGSSAIQRFENKYSTKTSSRQKKAREFFKQMNYYFTGEEHKKTLLIALMKRYAKDRDIERFSRLVSSLLTNDVQRRLLKTIRYFIPSKHKPYFDAIVNQNYSGGGTYTTTTPRSEAKHSPRDARNKKSPRDTDELPLRSMTWTRSTSTPYSKMESRTSSFSRLTEKSIRKESPCRLVHLERDSGTAPFGFTISGYNPVFLRSIDDAGPADSAGLKAGDCLIEINGINVRHASHDSVIEILKHAGRSPTFSVQWRPIPNNMRNGISPIRSDSQSSRPGPNQQQQNGNNSGSDSALESDISPRNDPSQQQSSSSVNPEPDQRHLLRHLKEQMNKLLTRGEQLVVKQAISYYHKDRDVQKLIENLEPVLDDPLKLQMLHCISRLLPPAAQLEFERLAVEMVARHMDNGIIISASTTAHEIFDILFRVQGSKLAETDRPRNLVGGLADVKTDQSSSKQISTSNSTGSLGSELDRSPRKADSSYEDLDITPVKDSTLEALMSIDDSQFSQGAEDGHGHSRIMATAMVHTPPSAKQTAQGALAIVQADPNNNGSQGTPAMKEPTLEETVIDDVFDEEVIDDRTRLTQKDIDDLKAELRKAQKQAEKARVEAEEGRLKLSQIPESVVATGSSPRSNESKPKDFADEIKDKSFGMEPERLRTVSTDDHVILPGQYIPPPPPPPLMAPAPPPPPPPLAAANAMQLKRINWEKLSGVAIENTVWGKLGNEEEVDEMIDFKELETLFSTKKRPKKEKKTEKKQASILDAKKTYNLSILLGHLKMPIDDIYKAVLSVDESKLSEPHIRTLLMCAPERLEIESFNTFSGDSKSLSTSDAFTAKMLNVPKYTERLRAMLFKARFYDRIDEIRPDMESVTQASEEVKSSKKLMKILEIVLATGNYMNQGSTSMSGASGFKISFLTKLISTKTSDNKSTLLHVIVNSIKNNKSDLLDVKDELSNVPHAAKVSSQMISLEIGELRTGMKEIQDELKNYESEDANDRFREVIGKFVTEAEKQFKELIDAYDQMTSSFKKTAEFYSETQITTEDFFGAFAIFLQNFESVKRDVMSEEEKREYYARKEKELEEIRKRRGSTISRSRTQSQENQTLVTSIDQNEIAKGFEFILKKRFPDDAEKEIETTELGIDEGAKTSKERVIAEPDERAKEQGLKSGASKISSEAVSPPKVLLPKSEPSILLSKMQLKEVPESKPSPVVAPEKEENQFTALLKRRQFIEGDKEEVERAKPDASIFSTLPRTKARPPPTMPKKKKIPPPPVRPKPKPGVDDTRAATLPRSMSKSNAKDERLTSVPVDNNAIPSRKISEPGYSSKSSTETSVAAGLQNIRETVPILREKEGNKVNKLEAEEGKENGIYDLQQTLGANNTVLKEVTTYGAIEIEKEVEKEEDSKTKIAPALKGDAKQANAMEEQTSKVKTETPMLMPVKSADQQRHKSNEIVVNLGKRLPTYKIEVSYGEQEGNHNAEDSRVRSESVGEKPKKPARKISEQATIKPFQTIVFDENDSRKDYDHDDDDYDNLPSDKFSGDKIVEEETVVVAVRDDPDYAIPNFADDSRKPEYSDIAFTQSQMEKANLEAKGDASLNGREKVASETTESNEDRSNATDVRKTNLYARQNRRPVRSMSLSSSQSSDGDSPKSYRKFKQSRSSISKPKASPLQKIKGVIDGIRSRSSSDASTTSYDPEFRPSRDFSDFSLKPILKYNDNDSLLNRSHSPHSVTFQDLSKVEREPEVVKLSSDSDDFIENSIRIPPLPKEPPPMPPLEPVAPPIPPLHRLKRAMKEESDGEQPPPMPVPYHLQKQSSLDSIKMMIPPPPSGPPPSKPPPSKPPPIPKSSPPVSRSIQPLPFKKPDQPQNESKGTVDDDTFPLSPTIPQFKPPPPPVAKQSPSSSPVNERRLRPPPVPKVVLSPSPPPLPEKLSVSNGEKKSKPPPPPKRVQSIQSSASYLKEALGRNTNSKITLADQLEVNADTPLARNLSNGVVNDRDEKWQPSEPIKCPTPDLQDFTVPLDDVPVIPPPPSPSPPKGSYMDAYMRERGMDSSSVIQKSNGEEKANILVGKPGIPPGKPSVVQRKPNIPEGKPDVATGKPSVSGMSMFMVKVLPTSPPLISRQDEVIQTNENGIDHRVNNSSQPNDDISKPDSGFLTKRKERAESVTSVSSISFPPLPPDSLLTSVEESYDERTDNESNFDESQVIFHF